MINKEEEKHHYPDPIRFTTEYPHMHLRHRVVIQAFDEESAKEKAALLVENGVPCDIETFVCYSDGVSGENRGEVILQREFHAAAYAPVEEVA